MKLENAFKPIKENSVEDHEKTLWERLLTIELEYINKIASFEIQPIGHSAPVNNIKELLSRHSGIRGYLFEEYENRTEKPIDEKKFETFADVIFNRICSLFKEDKFNWVELSMKILKEEIEKLGVKKSIEEEKDKDKWQAGILHFAIRNNLPETDDSFIKSQDRKKLHEQIIKLGITDIDPLLFIHFEALFKQEKEKNISLEDSLKELAVKIVDEHPEARAIVAQSWILDSAIAKKIGLSIYDRDETVRRYDMFWGQFIDKNGQIKGKEVSEFLTTGKPKYAVTAGLIPIEDFLRKYLPKEKRGKIILKSGPNPEIINKIEKEENALREITKNWDNISVDYLENNLSKLEIVKEFSETEKGKGFIEYILDLKKSGKKLEEIKENNELKKLYDEPWVEFKKQISFLNKEIFIE